MNRIQLGQCLLSKSLISEAGLAEALEIQTRTGNKIGQILIDLGLISDESLHRVLAQQLELNYVDLNFYDLDPLLLPILPETYARRYQAIILARDQGEFLVGMVDPLDINAVDAISKILREPIKIAVVAERALFSALDRSYRRTEEISNFAEELSGELADELSSPDALFDESLESEDQAPVVKLLNSLFRDAVQARASDIHIEPDSQALRIRFRVDGLLTESILDNKRILNPLIQRLKLRAHLDISERRIPQDGRFHFSFHGRAYDVRISTMPTEHGESVVMRLLDQSSPVSDLDALGIPNALTQRLKTIFNRPYGMLLVTGPTGSGKTTTLYSILSQLNTPERKILTVEDPVEYRMSRICQVQVNSKIDLSFARVLRSILRQDPDVILVGEIRDTETAQIAMRAAVTGHFVLASLHTNDALSSAIRLIDMGAEGYMVASAVKAIMGQRLVRSLCQACVQDQPLAEHEKVWLSSMGMDVERSYKTAAGCSHCGHRGYRGRVGVYELLELNAEMLNALRQGDANAFVAAALADSNYRPLAEEVLALVQEGKTSVAEAIRVIVQLDEDFRTRKPKDTAIIDNPQALMQ